MRVWVLVSWETDLASDTVGVFASRERAETFAREAAGKSLEWKRLEDDRGHPYWSANVGMFDGFTLQEFDLVE